MDKKSNWLQLSSKRRDETLIVNTFFCKWELFLSYKSVIPNKWIEVAPVSLHH